MKLVLTRSSKYLESAFLTDSEFVEKDFLTEQAVLDAISSKARASIAKAKIDSIDTSSFAVPGGKRLCPIVTGSNLAAGMKALDFLSVSFPHTPGKKIDTSRPTNTGSGDSMSEIPLSYSTAAQTAQNHACAYLVPPSERASIFVTIDARMGWTGTFYGTGPASTDRSVYRAGVNSASVFVFGSSLDIGLNSSSYSGEARYCIVPMRGSFPLSASDVCLSISDTRLYGMNGYAGNFRIQRILEDSRAYIQGRDDGPALTVLSSMFASVYCAIRKRFDFSIEPLTSVLAGVPDQISEGSYHTLNRVSSAEILDLGEVV